MKTGLHCCATLFALIAACGGQAASAPAPRAVASDTASMPPSAKAETKTDPAYAACHNTYKPTSNDQDVAADLDAMAKGCADTTKMKKAGDTLTGDIREKAPPVSFPLSAQSGKCYRIFGMSQSTMQDFNIAIVDSSGALVSQDTTEDASPVVAEDGKVCFKVSDAATIRAAAGGGGGKFALQVWSD
jgi:hypothetical protein